MYSTRITVFPLAMLQVLHRPQLRCGQIQTCSLLVVMPPNVSHMAIEVEGPFSSDGTKNCTEAKTVDVLLVINGHVHSFS